MTVLLVLLAAAVGFLAGRMLWLALRKTWASQSLMRTNHQGTSVPTAAGITIAFALLVVEAVRAFAGAAGIGDGPGLTPMRAAVLTVVLSFSLLGLLDDLVGAGPAKGFAGHLRALGRGQLTTGGMKLIGGLAAALIGASLLSDGGFTSVLIDAGIIALAANLINLFDLRPGRATKVSLVAFVLLVLGSGFDAALVPVALVVGAAAALMFEDLRERLMIGDTGANALGAALGLGLAAVTDGTAAIIALVALLAFNLLSEVVSFTKLFEKIGPLRSFDQLGRRKTQAVDVRDDQPPKGETKERSQTSAPAHATVGGAHEGSSAESTGVRQQSPFSSSHSRDRESTPSAPTRQERFSDDLFGFDRPPTARRPEPSSSPFGEDDAGPAPRPPRNDGEGGRPGHP